MTFTAVVTQAPHHSYLNGGVTATARQYFARPSQHVANGPRIDTATAGMLPGEFRPIWLDGSGEIFSVRNEANGQNYAMLDWTPHAYWDADTEQIYIGGKRGSYKLIAYSDVTGEWRTLPMPADLARATYGTAHWYGMTARGRSGKLYMGMVGSNTWEIDPKEEAFKALAPSIFVSSGTDGSSLTWAATANGGTGALLKYTGDAKLLQRYNPDTDTWTEIKRALPNGMHALVAHHPASALTLLVGGTNTTQVASIVSDEGVVTPVSACPQPVSMSAGSWCIPHPAGCWLVKGWPTSGDAHLYAGWPNASKTDVVWQDLGVAPDNGLTYSTAAPDYDRGLIYIVSTSGLHAYKMPDLSAPDGTLMITSINASNITQTTARITLWLAR